MQYVWLSKNDYERRARNVRLHVMTLLICYEGIENTLASCSTLDEVQAEWASSTFTGTYTDAKEQSTSFNEYKHTTKRTWVTERQDVTTLFGNIQTKLRTYGLREYVPPQGLALSVSDVPQQLNAMS